MHNEDAIAVEKLSEGIRKFYADTKKLEQYVRETHLPRVEKEHVHYYSVGMALASRWAAATFNRPGFEMFDFDVYALCGDGCMMEGISTEAASLAGHWKLSNLCWLYDRNKITIEGHTDLAFSEDVATKFGALPWGGLVKSPPMEIRTARSELPHCGRGERGIRTPDASFPTTARRREHVEAVGTCI